MTSISLKSRNVPPAPELKIPPNSDGDGAVFRESIEKYATEVAMYLNRYVVQQADDLREVSDTVLDAGSLSLLADIAADDKITPVEKYTIKPIWDAVVAEATLVTGKLPVQAALFSVDDSAFDAVYVTLYNLLITTYDVFGDMDTTTTIVRADWDSAWEAYFLERTLLINAIELAAKTLADNAQALLDDIADDGKITPVEKQTLWPIWQAVILEATLITGTLTSQATSFSVSDVDFDAAYAALYAYIITSLNVFGTMSATTTINRTTWDSVWQNYYDERTQLIASFEAGNRALVEAAQQLIDDIADDGKITPVEKLTIKPVWDAVVLEATLVTGTLPIQATAFGVSDAGFDAAYAALYGYIITSLDVFGTMSATTTINRTTWDGHWTTYYAERTDLINAIELAAKALADTAQALLDDIADDGKITPVEKLTILPIWQAIVIEATLVTGTLPVQATLFSVSDVDFDAAYDALYAYIITSLDVFGTMSATTTINRTTWDGYWKDYYDERTQLISAIEVAAKDLAEAAAATALWASVTGSGKPDDYADVTSSNVSANTSNVGTQSVATAQAAIQNFDGRNDRDATAITNPTIAADGSAVDHVINDDGSCDISLDWSWGGSEPDIDGFRIYVRASTSGASYNMGTTPSEEVVIYAAASRRALILYGVPVNKYFTFGVEAYRVVDPDVAAAGIITTAIIQPTWGGSGPEDPYQPASSVAFAGNVTGTIDGVSAGTVKTNAADGATFTSTDAGDLAILDTVDTAQIDNEAVNEITSGYTASVTTTTGSPIAISTSKVVAAGETVALIWSGASLLATNSTLDITIERDSTVLLTIRLVNSHGSNEYINWGGGYIEDTPGAGTYSYNVKSGNNIANRNCSIRAQIIKK